MDVGAEHEDNSIRQFPLKISKTKEKKELDASTE
jgi:hypothetical protein